MCPLSVGYPGRVKSSGTPRWYAHSSSARGMNFVQWSTVFDRGSGIVLLSRSSAIATSNADRESGAQK